jgi:hypothetical protein
MTPASDVFAILRGALEAASVRYAVGGSWASTAFGEPRFTSDVDILADFTLENVNRFLAGLPETFFADPEEILNAIRLGRPFNVIYMPMAFKFDFFPAAAFLLGAQELDRAVWLTNSGLSEAAAPFVTPEDILHRSQSARRPRSLIPGTECREARNRSSARTSAGFALASTPARGQKQKHNRRGDRQQPGPPTRVPGLAPATMRTAVDEVRVRSGNHRIGKVRPERNKHPAQPE